MAELDEDTDLAAGLGSTTALDEEVTVTVKAVLPDARVMPTVPAVGPKFVSQLSASAVGFATRVAVAWREPVQRASASAARGTVEKIRDMPLFLFLCLPALVAWAISHFGGGKDYSTEFGILMNELDGSFL